jgi:hypothetical protein
MYVCHFISYPGYRPGWTTPRVFFKTGGPFSDLFSKSVHNSDHLTHNESNYLINTGIKIAQTLIIYASLSVFILNIRHLN